MNSVKPFKAKNCGKIDLDAPKPNLKKGCEKIFSTFALYLQAPDVQKMAVTDKERFVLIC